MADRNLELAIKIQGQVDQSLPASVRKAMSDAANLQKSLGQLKGIEANAQRYKELQRAAQSLSTEFNQAKARAAQLGAEFRNNQAVAAQYKAQIEQAKAALAGMSRSANPEAYKAARANLAQLTAAYKTAKAAVKSSEADFKQAASVAKSSGAAYLSNQTALQKLSDELRQAGFNTEHFASSQENLQQQLNRTNTVLNQSRGIEAQYRAQQQQRAEQRRAHEKAQTNFFAAAGNFETAKSAASTIVSPFVGAIKTAADFQQVMSKVEAITGSSKDEMAKLAAQARELGSTTKFKVTEAGEAMTYLGMAGWKTEQILGGMPGLLNLAAASGTDLALTADIVSDGMTALGLTAGTKIPNAFGKMVDSTTHFADVMAAASSNANTNVQMMGETFKYAASTAGALGYSIDDLGLATGLMANAGVKGSQAGTALRAIFTRMATETDSASQAMHMLGISMTEVGADGKEKMKSFTKVIQEMRGAFKQVDASKITDMVEALSGSKVKKKDELIQMLNKIKENGGKLSELDKIKFSNMLAGQEAIAGLLTMVMGTDEDFNKLYGSIQKADGASAKMSATMQNNALGGIETMNSALEGLSECIGNNFLPYVESAARYVAGFVGGLTKWASENKGLATGIGIAAAAVAGLTVAVAGAALAFAAWGFFSTTIVEMKAAFLGLRAVTLMSAAATWIHTAATTALGAATNALKNPVSTATTLLGGMKNQMMAAKTAALGMPAMIGRAFTALPGLISGAFAALPGLMASLATVGLPVILAIAAIIAVIAVLAANWNNIKETATIVWNHISGTISAQVERIKAAFGDMVKRILAVWNSVTGGTATSADWILGIINNVGFAIGVAFDIAAGIVGNAISVIMNLVASIAQFIGGVVNIIVGIFTGDWAKIWTGASQAVEGLLGGTIGTFKTIAGGIGDLFDTLMGKADEVEQRAKQAQAAQNAGVTSDNSAAIANAQQVAAATQEAASASGEASANAQALANNMQGAGQQVQQTSGYMEQLKGMMENFPTGAQTASGEAVQAVQTNMGQLPQITTTNTDQMAAEFGKLAEKCQPGGQAFVQAANTWGQQAYENIANWAGQMAQVVVDRLSQAWSQISSQFSAGLHVNVTTSAPNVAHNAAGGIYNRGPFLTTFAEDSAEAAIPLDGSRRAIALWQQAGKMLGVLPPEISTIADVIAPPSEAQMAAAPVALEPPSTGGHVQVEINMPAITIQGNADGNTVANIEAVIARAVRDLERRIPDIMKANSHNERRTSLAT